MMPEAVTAGSCYAGWPYPKGDRDEKTLHLIGVIDNLGLGSNVSRTLRDRQGMAMTGVTNGAGPAAMGDADSQWLGQLLLARLYLLVAIVDVDGRPRLWHQGDSWPQGHNWQTALPLWQQPGLATDEVSSLHWLPLLAAAAAGQRQRRRWTCHFGGQPPVAVEVSLQPLVAAASEPPQLLLTISPSADDNGQQTPESLALDVVESTPNALLMVDESGRIALVNALAEQLFGYQREQLIGMPVEALVPASARHHHHQLRQGFMAQPSKREMGKGRELYALRQDGSTFPVEIGLNPLTSAEHRWVLAAVVDISARKAAQQRLETALHEKTVLLNEVHHRVKNNLQVISSLLNLQAGRASGEIRQALMESQSRVRAMSLIHQLIYEHHDLSRLDLGVYCQRLGSLLRELFASQVRQIGFDCLGTEQQVLVDLQQAVPCGLVVAEAVTNAFKHAFPDQRPGAVVVRLVRNDNQVAVMVEDNGVGIRDLARVMAGDTLGVQLMHLLAEQLHGRLAIEALAEGGTRVALHFQLAAEEVSA